MQFFPFVVVAWIVAVGLYGMVTSRHLVHQIVCLIVVQSSTYVLLLGVGYKTGAVAPYFSDIPVHTPAVDPGGSGTGADRRGRRGGRDRPAAGLRDPGPQAVRHPRPARTRPVQRLKAPLWTRCWLWPPCLPLLAAAAISALNMLLRGQRRVLDAVAILTAAAVAAMLAVIMARTAHGDAGLLVRRLPPVPRDRHRHRLRRRAAQRRAWPAWPPCW